MSSFITTSSDTSSAVAGWLTKMVSLPFGRSRWISRYFVLLDSELRFYKDVHSDSASQILNLRKVCQVIPTPTTQHPFCFRLEPQQYTNNNENDNMMRPWIIECKSEIDMENWISAIQNRIMKYNVSSPLLLSPKTPIPTATITAARIASTYSMTNNIISPELYRMPTLPLRCTNLNDDEEEEEEEEVTIESLLIRRNKKLAPIVTQKQQITIMEEVIAPQTPFSSTSTCSSTLPSPTGAVLGPLISPGIIDRYSHYNKSTRVAPCCNPTMPTTLMAVTTTKGGNGEEEDEECSSPTYLMYKKRFRL